MGSQVPRVHIMPDHGSTLGGVAVEFMDEHDMHMDEWQKAIVSDWLAYGGDGKFAASTAGLSVPRQNGKTFVLKCRCYFGICALGETILYTAHEVKTSRKTFEQMAADFDPDTGYPDLAEQVEYIRRANGQEEIKLRDWQDEDGEWHVGGCIIFSARSRGAARGFTADVFVADEAQELTSEQMAALLPTISAGRLQNNQTILIGTPPAPGQSGEIFGNTRDAAMDGSSGRICWHEWSVEEIGNVRDWQRVSDTNPALDVRLMRSAVESEMNTMPPDYFARERLGWWSAQAINAAIPSAAWARCATDAPPQDGTVSYGVKFSADGSLGCISACIKPTDGKPHVELVDARNMGGGLRWFADWLEPRSKDCAAIVIDGVAHAQPLVEELASRNVKRVVVKPRSGDVSAACSRLLNAVNEEAITHYDQPSLNESALNSTKRAIGTWGGWGFGGDSAAMIESAALAYWGAMTSKRKPGRKLRIG